MRRTLARLAYSSVPKPQAQARPRPKPVFSDAADDVEPGQHVIAVCKEHDIGFPHGLRPLRGLGDGQNPYKLALAVSKKHCFAKKSMRYFDKAEHPFAKSFLDFYTEKKKEPLWIDYLAYGASPFPNSKARSKLAHAMRDALKAAGYDQFGRKMIAKGQPSDTDGLHGTLRITCNDPHAVCNARFPDIRAYGDRIIRQVEIELGGGKDGRRDDKRQPQQSRSDRGAERGQFNRIVYAKGSPQKWQGEVRKI